MCSGKMFQMIKIHRNSHMDFSPAKKGLGREYGMGGGGSISTIPLLTHSPNERRGPELWLRAETFFQEKRGSRLFSEKYMGKDFLDKFLVNFDRSLGKNLPEHVSTNQVEGVFSNLKRGKGFSSYPMYTFLLDF